MEKSEYFNISRVENDHWWYKANREFSLSLLNKYLPKKSALMILDAGCGTGGTTVTLKRFGKVVGIDNSPTAIRLAKKYPIDQLILANLNNLPFKQNSFDLVTSFDVLYHQQVDPTRTSTELFRVLRPGGFLLVRVPAFGFLAGSHDKVVHTARRFTTKQIRSLFGQTGLKSVRVTYFNFSLFLPALIWRAGYNTGSTSDIGPVWEPLNSLLLLLLRFESRLALHTNLAWGTSVYYLGVKPFRK